MKIVSIQILPIRHVGREVVAQTEGATDQTNAYGVYERLVNGQVRHYLDFGTECDAVFAARARCKMHGVPLEPYPWQQELVAKA